MRSRVNVFVKKINKIKMKTIKVKCECKESWGDRITRYFLIFAAMYFGIHITFGIIRLITN